MAVLLVAVALAASAPAVAVAQDAPGVPSLDRLVTVMTWNIQGKYVRNSGGIAAFRREIESRGADIVGLQEVERNEARDLAGALGWGRNYYWQQARNALGPIRPEGVAIISRFPLKLQDSWKLPDPNNSKGGDRLLIRGVASVDNQEVYIYNTHFSSDDGDDAERTAQAEAVLKQIETDRATARTSGLPVVVLGDLNARPDQPAIQTLSGALTDAWLQHPQANQCGSQPEACGYTNPSRREVRPWPRPKFEPATPERRIDYIFVGGGIEVRAVTTANTPADLESLSQRSDHVPVMAQLAPSTDTSSSVLITEAIPPRPVTEEDEVFFDQAFLFFTPDGKGVISSTPDGLGAVYVDDEILVLVTRPDGTQETLIRNYEFQPPSPPIDLSGLLQPGTNTIRIGLRDTFGDSLSSTALWLVPVSSASGG